MTREEAIRFLNEQKEFLLKGCFWEETRMNTNEAFDMAIEALKGDVPETNVGKWIHLHGDEYFCNRCSHVVHTDGSWEHPLDVGKKFCEECGAKMEREK